MKKSQPGSTKPRVTGLTIGKLSSRPKQIALSGLVLVLIAGLAWVLYSSWRPGDSPEQSTAPTSQTESTDENPKDETSDSQAVVPDEQPQYMSIDKLGIHQASVAALGIESNGEMAAPATNQAVGWYRNSSLPSDDDGSILMNGHVGLESEPAVFAELHSLTSGDIISIQNHGGQDYDYTVYHVEQLPTEDVDMRKMMRSVDPTRQGLNIITCAGEYDADGNTFTDRVLVYAVRAQ